MPRGCARLSALRAARPLIGVVHADADTADSLELLASAARIAAAIDEAKDGLLGYFADRCRGKGKSWTEISSALGVTRQAVTRQAANRRFGGAVSLDRFTARARRVVEMSSAVARSLDHGYVGTEHVLLRDPDALAERILSAHQVTADETRQRVVELVQE